MAKIIAVRQLGDKPWLTSREVVVGFDGVRSDKSEPLASLEGEKWTHINMYGQGVIKPMFHKPRKKSQNKPTFVTINFNVNCR